MNGLLRTVGETTLEKHPALAKDIAMLILSVFREVTEPDLPKTANLVFLPEKLAQVFSDDIYLSYSTLAQLLPEMKYLDPSATRNLILDSNLIHMLLYRAGPSEDDQAVRIQSLSFLLELWSYESSNII